jgi:hypothetical protein
MLLELKAGGSVLVVCASDGDFIVVVVDVVVIYCTFSERVIFSGWRAFENSMMSKKCVPGRLCGTIRTNPALGNSSYADETTASSDLCG